MAPARCGVLLVAIAAAAAPPAAAAGDAPLGARRLLLEVGARATAFDYSEHGAAGAWLDGEHGVIPGLDGALELRAGPLTLRATAAVSGARVEYAGLVQSSSVQLNGLTATSTSGAHLAAAGGEVAVAIARARGVAIVAGGERRRWDRNIHDTSVVSRAGTRVAVRGLAETYRWAVLQAGVRIPILAAPRLGWDADVRITRALHPSVTVARSGGDVRLPLGARSGWVAGTTLRVAFGATLVARLGVSVEGWAFGESDVDPRTGIWEPRSRTRTVRGDAGVGARF